MSRDKDLVSSQAGLAAAISVESGPELGEGTEPVRARSYWEQVWIRFRRDKVAMVSGFFIIFLILVAAVGGPIAAKLLGHGPNDIFFNGVNDDLLPVGPWTHVQTNDGGSTLFILGADGTLGRDEFLRLLYGARVSLEVAVLSTIGVMIDRDHDGRRGRLLPRLDRRGDLAGHRGDDGVPGTAVHHRAVGDGR